MTPVATFLDTLQQQAAQRHAWLLTCGARNLVRQSRLDPPEQPESPKP